MNGKVLNAGYIKSFTHENVLSTQHIDGLVQNYSISSY